MANCEVRISKSDLRILRVLPNRPGLLVRTERPVIFATVAASVGWRRFQGSLSLTVSGVSPKTVAELNAELIKERHPDNFVETCLTLFGERDSLAQQTSATAGENERSQFFETRFGTDQLAQFVIGS